MHLCTLTSPLFVEVHPQASCAYGLNRLGLQQPKIILCLKILNLQQKILGLQHNATAEDPGFIRETETLRERGRG